MPVGTAAFNSIIRGPRGVAKLPNVAVKATGAPGYSSETYPFPIMHTYLEKIYDALEINLPKYISYEEAKKLYDKKRLSFLNESRVLDTTKMKKIFPGCIKYTKLCEGIKASL